MSLFESSSRTASRTFCSERVKALPAERPSRATRSTHSERTARGVQRDPRGCSGSRASARRPLPSSGGSPSRRPSGRKCRPRVHLPDERDDFCLRVTGSQSLDARRQGARLVSEAHEMNSGSGAASASSDPTSKPSATRKVTRLSRLHGSRSRSRTAGRPRRITRGSLPRRARGHFPIHEPEPGSHSEPPHVRDRLSLTRAGRPGRGGRATGSPVTFTRNRRGPPGTARSAPAGDRIGSGSSGSPVDPPGSAAAIPIQ